LIQLAPDVKALEGPTGAGRDFTDLHAWCEVYLPGAGWIGLDPTSGLLAGEGHIPLACTPEPTSAAPVSAALSRARSSSSTRCRCSGFAESPRVTKPYTDAQWETILACGRAVDEDFAAGDVRLTMGGEPTFVSTTDRDADEWNTAALGPTKRARAADLLLRLKRRYGANGFVHQGQGKWYPGEQLPRWTLGCYWRADGEPAWMDASLFADDQHHDGHGAGDAERFITALAAQLEVTAGHMQAGYEDVWYYLWRERKLPVNVDPFDRAPRRRTGARPLAPRLHARSRRHRWVRPADSAGGRTRRTLGDGAVVPARRAALSGSRRFADGTPAAARLAAVVCAWRPPHDRRARSVCAHARRFLWKVSRGGRAIRSPPQARGPGFMACRIRRCNHVSAPATDARPPTSPGIHHRGVNRPPEWFVQRCASSARRCPVHLHAAGPGH